MINRIQVRKFGNSVWNIRTIENGKTIDLGQITHHGENRYFQLRIRGIYWRGGEPRTSGGTTSTGCDQLTDAICLAVQVIERFALFNEVG